MVAAVKQSAARALSLNGRAASNFNSYPRSVRAPGSTTPRQHADVITPGVTRLAVPAAAAAEGSSDSAADDASALREENAALRAALASRLDKLDAAQKEAFFNQHAELAKKGEKAGEPIPQLEGAPAPKEKTRRRPAAAAAAVESASESTPEAESVPEPEAVAEPVAESTPAPDPRVILENDGVSAVVEVEHDNTLVFKFSTEPSPAVSNGGDATSMAAEGLPGKRATTRGRSSKAAGPSSDPAKEVVVTFTFDSDAASSTPVAEPATPAVPKAAAAAAPIAASSETEAGESSGSSGSESDAEGITTKARRKRSPSATGAKTTRTRSSSPPKKAAAPKKVDPYAATRDLANSEAESHVTATTLAGREHWLYLTVPAVPVAGATCTLYYNRAQSEVLRDRPRIQMQARFNNWELEPAGDCPDRLELVPAEGAPKGEGTDFWRVSFTVPTEAYELNFIFSDSEGLYDNNNTLNYSLPVDGPMTRDLWIDTAPERAEAAYLAKKEAERIAAEKADAEREAAALAADAQRADETIAELKASYGGWSEGGAAEGKNAAGVAIWRTTPAAVAGGKTTVMYNRTAGPISGFEIPEDQQLNLRIGHNGWKGAHDILMKRANSVVGAAEGDEWWEAAVEIPRNAVALNFVVQYYEHFDNNGGADYKASVSLPAGVKSVESWADGMLAAVRADITTARHAEEAAIAERERAREDARNAVRAKTEAVRRKQMRHVLFTEPPNPVAGREVTISYNPNNTVLHGAERVFLRGSYNRWRHPKGFGPVEMTAPTEVGSQHFTATVNVPKDAYCLDFVFGDAEEGGRYDNRGGLDYHLPVEGSVVSEPPLYVVHVAAEMAPIAKVGGLGDVVTALGRAVQEAGHQVEVILPRYDFFLQSPLLGNTQYETEFDWNGIKLFVSSCVVENIRCWFIEPSNGMFATSTVYQGATDEVKFKFFSKAALEFLLRTQRQPDILHCHDWSTAEVAKAYWTEYHAYGLWRPKVIFTIHNLNYGATDIGNAAYFSQRFTTVSPTYAWEIGGHPAVAPHSAKLMGIRNGIDIDIWNPETDQFLPMGYTAENAEAGKAAAREELRRRVGLSGWGDKPLIGVVTRLTKQKGTHLIAHSAYRTIDRGGQFVLLGSAPDPKVQAEFDALKSQYGGENAAFCFAFDEPLSHLIYAACDLILVPSMFEPCGLTQMIAMRYGAVPVVRATGGLKDTVFDVDTDKPRAAWELEGSTNWQADEVDATNGFAFEGTDPGALDYALNRAIDAWYNDRAWFRSLQQRVMRQDWSWNKPAIDYIELYYAALK